MHSYPIVTAENITKEFLWGDEIVHVLHGINLELYTGQLAMLVGPSGCGKTTFLSIVSGVLSPSSGKVHIDRTDLTSLEGDDKVLFRRKKIGFIFQQYHLFSSLTAAENATIPLLAANFPREQALEKAVDILNQIGMEECVNKFPAHLSGGEQQRVAIARALIHDPCIIICDEPTSALDHHTGETVMKILRRVAVSSGRTVLVVTHDSRIFQFADRIIYMDDGNIIKEEIKTQEKHG